jgi:hypothetical protein
VKPGGSEWRLAKFSIGIECERFLECQLVIVCSLESRCILVIDGKENLGDDRFPETCSSLRADSTLRFDGSWLYTSENIEATKRRM